VTVTWRIGSKQTVVKSRLQQHHVWVLPQTRAFYICCLFVIMLTLPGDTIVLARVTSGLLVGHSRRRC
jgi:hypothetical protein